jgi:hypothetical protein
MSTRTKIKVIKKGAEEVIETPVITEEDHQLNDDTKLASTVSGWIDEVQERRVQERKSAIERFHS